ncbi:DNA-directed RNA polymerases I, II, and III subunit RPABC4, partial [Ascosphaera atra]
MSREAYQVPSMGVSGSGLVEGSTSDNVFVTYICGDCNARIQMKRSDPIRCKECGHRVLYKERTQ